MIDQPSPEPSSPSAARADRESARKAAQLRRRERQAARRLQDLAPEVEFDPELPQRSDGDEKLEEFVDRWRIPILAGVAVLLFAGTRFKASRPYEATFVALALPVVAVVMGALPLRDAHPKLRAAAFGVGGLVLLASELSVSHALFPAVVPALPFVPFVVLFGLLALAAALVEALASGRGILNRFAPWVGMTVALSLYLPAHIDLADRFSAVLAGVIVALFAGGLGGLLLGMGASRLLTGR